MSDAGWRVLYDADCGFCRWALGWVLRWDRDAELEPMPIQDAGAQELLAAVPEAERLRSWHLVAPDEKVTSAGPAAAPLLRRLPGGRGPAALFERMPGVIGAGYRWVAAHRSLLGKPVTAAAKLRADALIAERRARGGGGVK